MDDNALRRRVLDELEFDPNVRAARIGVSVTEGVVTLSGYVPAYPDKSAAERAAWRAYGVKAVADEIEVHFGTERPRDEELARRVVESLARNPDVPDDAVHPTVHNGWITLEGRVQWQHQLESAERALRSLHGVTGISNNIVLRDARACGNGVAEKVMEAVVRSTPRGAQRVRVEAKADGTVIVYGEVESWAERQAVLHTAWCVPNVRSVVDQLHIVPIAVHR